MVQSPLQQYILMINDWVAETHADNFWTQLGELYQQAQKISQLFEDIIVWLDFKGREPDAYFFVEHVGECHEAMLRVYLWSLSYPNLLPSENHSCLTALEHVRLYAPNDIRYAQQLDDQLPKEVWNGFDSH